MYKDRLSWKYFALIRDSINITEHKKQKVSIWKVHNHKKDDATSVQACYLELSSYASQKITYTLMGLWKNTCVYSFRLLLENR